MTLRIIGGKFKNRLIKTPKGLSTRPTSSILRKAVFDICQNEIEGAKFLDLFAGSGAMGIEALSRGAQSSTFIDLDKGALLCIQANVELLNIAKECEIKKGDSLLTLQRFVKEGRSFDIVYIDPPYGQKAEKTPLKTQVMQIFDLENVLLPNGTLFLEEEFPSHFSIEKLQLQNLIHINSRRFGKSILHQYRKKS
jgi:16S rRNA (guanine966-N2)-methyltransferase